MNLEQKSRRGASKLTWMLTAHIRSVPAIAARLRATRAALDLNQRQLCAASGIAPNRYNQWEKGHGRPDIDGAIALREAFGITLDWIFLGDPSGLPRRLALKLPQLEAAE